MNFFNSTHQKLILDILERIKSVYKARLVSLVVYGSYARNEAKLNSDLDMLLILRQAGRLRKEIDAFYDNIEEPFDETLQYLFEHYGINLELSPLILTEENSRYFQPLYFDMIEHSEIIYDSDRYFENLLKKVKETKENNNFTKETVGNTYLWDFRNYNILGVRL